MIGSINDQLRQVYKNHGECFVGKHLFVSRVDGTNLFSNEAKSSELSVLIGSLWQAAYQVKSISKMSGAEDQFRLSFDLADKGIFVKCVETASHKYIVTLIYEHTMNPGLLKKQMADFCRKLKIELKDDVSKNQNIDKKLFYNLTDKEVDDIFLSIRDTSHVVC